MQLYRDFPLTNNLSKQPPLRVHARGSVVTVGNFDGVHLGHQALIKALHALARPQGLTVRVVTFAPHPRDYFSAQGRGSPVLHIGSVRDRLTRLDALGVNGVHLLRFNHALATLSPHDFVEQVLVDACHAEHVVVGRDVRFGHQRAGDLALLHSLGERYGFTVHAFDEVLSTVLQHSQNPQDRIASSAVRQTLHAGDIVTANALLGYDYSISGRVIHGRKLGRTLGCPTLNLTPRMANPAFRGIAVVAIDGLNDSNGVNVVKGGRCYGVASLGLRPTVEQTTRYSLEVHAFDWSGNAYGKRVSVTFLHKLRDEAAYIDLSTLQTAIEQDMVDARAWLSQHALI